MNCFIYRLINRNLFQLNERFIPIDLNELFSGS